MASHGHLYEMFSNLAAASTFGAMDRGHETVGAGGVSGAPQEAIGKCVQVPNYTQVADAAPEGPIDDARSSS